MTDRRKFKDLYEYQSGDLPLEQVLAIEIVDNGQRVPIVCAFFADAEMDVFMVQYGPDEEEITLHAEGVTHISTAPFQLQQIIDLYPGSSVALCRDRRHYEQRWRIRRL